MTSSEDRLVQEIHARVETERTQLSALEGQIKDTHLRRILYEAVHWLDDVENIFLQSARHENRTPEELTRWLSYAEQPLGWAIARRKELQEIVAKYGPDVQTQG
jgi:hypothetical protein